MANLGFTFTQDMAPAQDTNYDALPAGWYDATIASADLKDSKSGGQYINIRYDITGPTHQGRVVFGMITVRNSNSKAEDIGLQQLGLLIKCIGIDNLTDTDQLIGGPVTIRLSVEESKKYGTQNRVSGFKESSSKPAVKQSATTASPPWAKK